VWYSEVRNFSTVQVPTLSSTNILTAVITRSLNRQHLEINLAYELRVTSAGDSRIVPAVEFRKIEARAGSFMDGK
jgi:hypothetical protein